MTEKEFFERLKSNPHPVVADFWAPWCVPCRAIEPVVKKLTDEYAGRVDVWKINADEHPDLLRALRIYGIPTLAAFHAGQEVSRRTGAASVITLTSLFDSALSGVRPAGGGPKPIDRVVRLASGLFVVVMALFGGLSGMNLLLAALGGLIMFTAVYDRCPIYKMVSTRLKELFQRKSTPSSGS